MIRRRTARPLAVLVVVAGFALAALLPSAPASAAGYCFYGSTDLGLKTGVGRGSIAGNDGCVSELRVEQTINAGGIAASILTALGIAVR
jgi:hypothetical protein